MQYLAIIEDHLPGSTPVGGCGCEGKWPRTLCAVAPIEEAVLTPGDPSPAGRCPCCNGLVYPESGK